MSERGGLNRKAIERAIDGKGDYVKIDYLNRCLGKGLDFDTKKYVLVKLAGIYELRKMYFEAARLMKNAAEINTTFQGKINDFIKSGELYVKAGKFLDADISFGKALACGNSKQREEIKRTAKEFYKAQAISYLNKDKRSNAAQVYEKILTLNLTIEERVNAQEKLLELYQRLGKIREYYILRKSILGRK